MTALKYANIDSFSILMYVSSFAVFDLTFCVKLFGVSCELFDNLLHLIDFRHHFPDLVWHLTHNTTSVSCSPQHYINIVLISFPVKKWKNRIFSYTLWKIPLFL